MTKDIVPYIRFIHGYLFMLVVSAFALYAAGNSWGIQETYLAWFLEFSAAGSAAYLVISVIIILILVLQRIAYRKKGIGIPIFVTVICSLVVLPLFGAAEALIILFG